VTGARPEVSGGDRPSRCVSDSLDRATGLARLGRRDRGTQPAVGESSDAVESLRPVAAQPDLEWLLHRLWIDAHAVEHESVESMRHLLARPPRPQERDDLLDQLPPVARPDTERESFVRLVDAGHEAEQYPSAGELIELRERLGEDHGVATERHDVGTQLEPF